MSRKKLEYLTYPFVLAWRGKLFRMFDEKGASVAISCCISSDRYVFSGIFSSKDLPLYLIKNNGAVRFVKLITMHNEWARFVPFLWWLPKAECEILPEKYITVNELQVLIKETCDLNDSHFPTDQNFLKKLSSCSPDGLFDRELFETCFRR